MSRNKRKNKPFKTNDKIIKGTTKSGFRYAINTEVFRDMELYEVAARVDDDILLTPKFLEKLLGKKQKENLYNFVRNNKGMVPVEKVSQISLEILENKELKNYFTLLR